jgi:uncharacterized paraquat-inducible protein A
MYRIMTIVAVAAMCWVGGCKSDSNGMSDSGSMKSGDGKMMTADACPHCPGNQTATAQGTCPVCGMKLH